MKFKNRKAFTLIEMLIVVIFIAILSIVLVAFLNRNTDKAKSTGVQTDMRSLQVAIRQVGIEFGEFTGDLVLLADQMNENLDKKIQVHYEDNMLKTDVRDPWGNVYHLLHSRPNNTLGRIEIVSAGEDEKYNTPDDYISTITYKISGGNSYITISDNQQAGANNGSSSEVDTPSENPEMEHVHEYTQKRETAQYISVSGTCQTVGKYFYSCKCGAKGTETFDGSKDPTKHASVGQPTYSNITNDKHTVIKKCTACNATAENKTTNHSFNNGQCACGKTQHMHTFDRLKTDAAYEATAASCKGPAKYYYSCECGTKGSEMFEWGEPLDHSYKSEIISEANCQRTGVTRFTCEYCNSSEDVTMGPYAHLFVNDAQKRHLVSAATCAKPATYRKVCYTCNTVATSDVDVFTDGEVDPNNHGELTYTYEKDTTIAHTKIGACPNCPATFTVTENHTLNEGNNCVYCGEHVHNYIQNVVADKYQKSIATCTSEAVYYKSCICDDYIESDENLFVSGTKDPNEHSGTLNNVSELNICQKYSCCKVEITKHTLSAEATCTTAQVCTICGFEKQAAYGHNPSYEPIWNTDHTTVTMNCTACEHVWTGTVVVSNVQQPGCGVDGFQKHIATFGLNGTYEHFECDGHVVPTQHPTHVDGDANGLCDNCSQLIS